MDLAFVTPAFGPSAASAPAAPPALRASAAPGAGQQEGFSAKAAAAVCGMVAAAGLAASRRRTAMRAAESSAVAKLPAHMQPVDTLKPQYEWTTAKRERFICDWANPVPGSEKALLTMVGASVETGSEPGKPWDPVGFSKLYDRNFDFNGLMTYPHVQWLREAEIKHGRCAMLAFVGIMTQQLVRIPGYPDEPDWTKALDACYNDPKGIAAIGIAQISLTVMLIEGKFGKSATDSWIGEMDREPGDYGFDPLKLSKSSNFDMKAMQLKELKNGRLAMMAFLSCVIGWQVPGAVPGLGALSALPRDTASISAAAFCGETRVAAHAETGDSKTAARYTTQTILPALAWIKTGVKLSDIQPTQLKAVTLVGNDVLIGKTESGALFCVGNLCPHIGTPLSEGADVIGDVIVCPLHGSSFKTTTGELIDWCVSPPIIGPLTGLVVEKKNLLIFECRQGGFFGSGDIEVLVDTNAKKAYEADYWKGLLDAQGKDDGTFY